MYRTVSVFALVCAIATVAATKVRVDFEHSANYSNYRTYRWAGPPDVQYMNQLMTERVTGFVEEALACRHLTRVKSGGDLLVRFQIRVHEQEQYFTYSTWPGFDWDWGTSISTTVAEPILLGTLTVDLVDARRDQLVFQGVSTDSISSKPEKNTKELARAVNKIFEKYPPR
jgi:hypothetical protein